MMIKYRTDYNKELFFYRSRGCASWKTCSLGQWESRIYFCNYIYIHVYIFMPNQKLTFPLALEGDYLQSTL